MLYKVKHESSTADLLWALNFHGLSRDVSRQLGVSRQYISQVIHKVRRDARVIKALRREYRRRLRNGARLLDRESAA